MARPRRSCIQGAHLTVTTEAPEDLPGSQARLALPLGPRGFFSVLLAAFIVIALIHGGAHAFAQTTLNGLTSGAYFALGAVGLTFIYGSLRLINFAHGDFLTFGAYMGFLANVTLHLPLAVCSAVRCGSTAALGVTTEKLMWKPMRSRRAAPSR